MSCNERAGLLVGAPNKKQHFTQACLCANANVPPCRLSIICAALILLAIVLRLVRYGSNPAIWLDEALLLDNLFDLSLLDLLGPLYHQQAAPWGFLLLTRLAMYVFGISEYALRLLSVLASCASPVLVYLVARRFLSITGMAIALTLFAISPAFIYFASELKPYASDAAIALGLYVLAIQTPISSWKRIHWLSAACAGAAAPWFSLPSIFILFGIGTALAGAALASRDTARMIRLAALGSIWGLSFGFYYIISLSQAGSDPALHAWWTHAYMPFPPRSITDLRWFVHAFAGMFEEHVGRIATPITAVFFVAGAWALVKRAPVFATAALLPWGAALAASAFGSYPFTSRFLLFVAPMLFVFIGAGVELTLAYTNSMSASLARKGAFAYAAIWILVALLLFPPLLHLPGAFTPTARDIGIRPEMRYLARQFQPGDWLYVQYWAHYPFRYYARRYGIPLDAYTAGITSRADWSHYAKDIERLEGKPRVWVLLQEVDAHLSGGEMSYLEQLLSTKGKQIDKLHTTKASLFLYEMKNPNIRPFQAVEQK